MRRCDLLSTVFVLVLSLVTSSTSLASITLVGQDRRVQSSTFVATGEDFDSDVQQFVSQDGDPFEANANVIATIEGATGSASAMQTSSVELHAVHALGSYAAQSELQTSGTAYSSCETNVALRFSIPASTTYFLQGYVEAFDGGVSKVQFSRPFLTLEFFSASDQRIDLNETGTITAGTYDLNVTANGVANTDLELPAVVSGGYEIHLMLGTGTDAPVVATPVLAAAPNPFIHETRLSLPTGEGRVSVLDLAGRVVRTLQGASPLTWDGRDDRGRALGAGVYWMRAEGIAGEPVRVVRLR